MLDVADAHTVSRSATNPTRNFGIKGDVFVTGCVMESVPKSICPSFSSPKEHDEDSALGFLEDIYDQPDSTTIHFPSSGFILSEAFGRVGGIDGLLSLCGKCPANTLSPHPAGCAGSIFLYPHDGVLQEQLAEAIDRLRLRDRLDEYFLRTSPIWFGLWTRSPLSPAACEVLELLVNDLIEQGLRPANPESTLINALDDLRAFARATRISRENNIPLHVSLAPSGHCDLGWSTTFAHCPRCKAEADLPRWKRRYPSNPYTCNVCSLEYVPSATASSEREDFDLSRTDLRKVLGPKRFDAFAIRFLIDRGMAPDEARQVLDHLNAKQQAAEAQMEEQKRRDAQRQQFTEAVLYAGLHPAQLPGSDEDGQPYFRADDLRELIRRCKATGANVLFLFHESSKDDLCLSERVGTSRAEKLLDDWQKRGCNELFMAVIGVPDHVLDKAANAG